MREGKEGGEEERASKAVSEEPPEGPAFAGCPGYDLVVPQEEEEYAPNSNYNPRLKAQS